jgi:hypothetical protein
MSIISHRPKSGANTSDVSADGRELTAELWVESDDPEDTGHSVIQYLIGEGFVYGAPYNIGNDDLSSRTPVNTALYQIESPQLQPGSATLWSVTLRYRQVTPQQQTISGTVALAPWSRWPQISITTTPRETAISRAIYRGGFSTGWAVDEMRAVTNSAGTPFGDVITVDDHDLVIRVARSFPAVAVNQTNMPLKWINSQAFTLTGRTTTINIAAYQLRFLSWSTNEEFSDGYDYVNVEFEGALTKDGWRFLIQDNGLALKAPENPYANTVSTIAIRDAHQNVIETPALLDGNGGLLADGDPPVYATWSGYDEIDPRSLGFFAGLTI